MSRKLLGASLAAAVGIAVFVLQLEDRPIYAYGVGQYLERDIRDRTVRVGGMLVPGSLCRAEPHGGYRFALVDALAARAPAPDTLSAAFPMLPVSYESCVLPDTFRDVPGYPLMVAVEGKRCQTCHDLKATQVMAKCPSKYQFPSDAGPPHPARPLLPCNDLVPQM